MNFKCYEVFLDKLTLRECVEKLELLKAPEERQRRLHEIPEVHADPKMDPNCESDEDAGEVGSKKRGPFNCLVDIELYIFSYLFILFPI